MKKYEKPRLDVVKFETSKDIAEDTPVTVSNGSLTSLSKISITNILSY